MEGRCRHQRVRDWRWLAIIIGAVAPGVLARAGVIPGPVLPATALYGTAVVAAAFVLTWTAEAAEHDVPQSLALTVLALIAVLPEYAVDMTFAWKAGAGPEAEREYGPFALANMTGGNRLLAGLGWFTVVGIVFLRSRRPVLELARSRRLEVPRPVERPAGDAQPPEFVPCAGSKTRAAPVSRWINAACSGPVQQHVCSAGTPPGNTLVRGGVAVCRGHAILTRNKGSNHHPPGCSSAVNPCEYRAGLEARDPLAW